MAVAASVQPEPDRIVCAESDFPHPIRFHFSKEGLDRIVQNRPGSDLDDLVRVWPHIPSGSKPVRRNHLARFLAQRHQPATSFFFFFLLSDSVPFFHRWPGSYIETSADLIWFWLTPVRLWPNGSSPEASQCARIIRPASGQRVRVDPDRMRI